MARICNHSAEKVETGGSLGLADKLAYPPWGVPGHRETLSKKRNSNGP